MQNLEPLASLYPEQASLSCLVGNPEDRFSHDVAHVVFVWAGAQPNQKNDLCAQWRLRSAQASTQSDQSSPCA